jgi:hypothetical protein
LSFLYPHTCEIRRPAAQPGEGKLAYGGQTQASETRVKGPGIPCNIELRREGQRNTTGLPGDGTRPTYDVRFKRRSALAYGDVRDRDVLVDGLGQRYLVVANPWLKFGYALRVERLEA